MKIKPLKPEAMQAEFVQGKHKHQSTYCSREWSSISLTGSPSWLQTWTREATVSSSLLCSVPSPLQQEMREYGYREKEVADVGRGAPSSNTSQTPSSPPIRLPEEALTLSSLHKSYDFHYSNNCKVVFVIWTAFHKHLWKVHCMSLTIFFVSLVYTQSFTQSRLNEDAIIIGYSLHPAVDPEMSPKRWQVLIGLSCLAPTQGSFES